MSAVPTRGRTGAQLWQILAADLSAAWCGVALLYFMGAPNLPEPVLALVISTVIGAGSAGVKAVRMVRTKSSLLAEGRGHRVPISPLPPQHSRAHPADARPVGFAFRPGWSNSAGGPPAPAVESAAPVALRPPANMNSNAEIGEWSLDPTRYGRVDRSEIQCPRCGSFDVGGVRDSADPELECGSCHERWQVDALSPRDVVVRSWLNR